MCSEGFDYASSRVRKSVRVHPTCPLYIKSGPLVWCFFLSAIEPLPQVDTPQFLSWDEFLPEPLWKADLHAKEDTGKNSVSALAASV